MTPEMWLDLEPIPHRASCYFAADRQNPSGIQRGVALLVAWLVISRSTRERCHLLSCDVCHGWEGWDTNFFHDLLAVIQAHHVGYRSGLPGSEESDLPMW